MNWSITRKMLLQHVLQFFILAGVGGFAIYSLSRAQDMANWITRTHQVLERLNLLKSDLLSAESDLRGYALSDNYAFFQAYLQASARVDRGYWELQQRMRSHPENGRFLLELKRRLDAEVDWLTAVLETYQGQGAGPTAALIVAEKGTHLMEQALQKLDALQTEVQRLWDQRRSELNRQEGITDLALAIMGAVSGFNIFRSYRGITRHIRARDQADKALKESEARFVALFEDAPLGYHTLDREGRFAQVNRTELTMLGYTAEEMVGQHPWNFLVEQDQSRSAIREKLAGRTPLADKVQRTFRRKDGTTLPVLLNNCLLHDPAGRVIGISSTVQDITERLRAETALRESEERYRTVVENIGIGVTLINPQMEILALNAQMRKWFPDLDLRRPPLCYQTFHDPHQEAVCLCCPTAQTLQDGLMHEALVDTPQGDQRRNFRVVSSPVKDTAGRIIAAIELVENFTERKAAQAAVVESEKRAQRLVDDILEHERREAILNQALEDAKAADRAKNEFLANVSHEIRTPMNGIMGMAQVALMSDPDQEQRECLETIMTSCTGLMGIIEHILDFSRIEARRLTLVCQPFALRRELDEILKPLALLARQRGLQMSWESAANVPDDLVGDAGQLRQVLTNLVGNAIKFTERGEVRLAVRQESADESRAVLHFAVQDTGIGIAPDKREHIFGAFNQEDGSYTRKYGGLGLGLAISAKLVELMNGRIWVESEKGRGSVFHFTVEVGLSPDAAGAIRPGPKNGRRTKPDHPDRPLADLSRTVRPLCILVAEDNQVNRILLVRMLQKMGHEVQEAVNGQAVLRCLETNSFDLVMMDLQMPEMDGYETTAVIRAQEAGSDRHLPVVAVTAHVLRKDKRRCLDYGMDGYLSKPIGLDSLSRVLTAVMRKRGQAQATQTVGV